MLHGAMLVKNESGRWLEKVLEQMKSICDTIVVLDDMSTDNTPEICKAYGADVFYSDRSYWGTDELRQRKFLWELVTHEAKDGDWIFILDADETIPLMQFVPQILKTIKNQCDGLAFRLYDMWNETHYRDDEWWIGHYGCWPMIVQYHKNKEYIWNNTPLHCGRFPKNAIEWTAQCEIAIQHWGWSRPEDRQKKYERYMKADPEGKWGFMGQYQSILDPNPNLRRFDLEAEFKRVVE
jgi:glycosyltransferase involved in cell wall biosynthesis